MFLVITARLQMVLKKEGTPIKFGVSPLTRYLDESCSLMTLLQIYKRCDTDSWIVFVALVKDFDTIHHELMFSLFKKIDEPDKPLKPEVIIKLYKNFKFEVSIGKS